MFPDIFRDSAAGHILQRGSRDRFSSNTDERQSSAGSSSLHGHNLRSTEPDATSSSRSQSDILHKISGTDQSVELTATNAESTESTIRSSIDPKDPASPHNWSKIKKLFVASEICFYTFTVYLGSSIVLASIPCIVYEYQVSETLCSLTIAAYVFGYGIGALLFSPISEIESVGRNIPYIISFAFFVLISALAATCQNFPGLVFLRFLQGFFGSPALATGAASMQDMFHVQYLPLAFLGWMGAATLGPAIGPIISVFSVDAESWRWPLWEMLWLSSGAFLVLFVALPETSHAKILHHRQSHLGLDLFGPGPRASISQRLKQSLVKNLYRPTKIMLTHPTVAFANIYTCLIYGLYYTFFECIPRTYSYEYGFSNTQTGLCFFSIAIGALLGTVLLLPWSLGWIRAAKTLPPTERPERSLVPGLYASVAMPICLFVFAWTSRASIHWSVSLLGIAGYTTSMFTILQCLANYLILVHPEDAASLFAGNDFMRATTAAAAVVFSHPLYNNLGVAKGVTILAVATSLCTVGLFVMYRYSPKLYGRHQTE